MKPFNEILFDLTFSILTESLDSPYQLHNITKDVSPDLVSNLKGMGYDNMEFHQCVDEPGHAFFVGRRNSAYEIHHQHVKDGVELHDKNVLGKVPSKFVATTFSLIHKKVDGGKPVRIIATDDHINSYHRLSKIVGSKFGYHVSDYSTDEMSGDHSFMITPPKTKGIFGGMQIKRVLD